jgi:hypothetical protein
MPDRSDLHFSSVKPFLDWYESQSRRYELVGGRWHRSGSVMNTASGRMIRG